MRARGGVCDTKGLGAREAVGTYAVAMRDTLRAAPIREGLALALSETVLVMLLSVTRLARDTGKRRGVRNGQNERKRDE